MKHENFDNVWFALEADEANAINMTMRSDLMTGIERSVATWNLSQVETAKRLHIDRSRLNDLLRGRINKFTIDALSKIATRAGLTVKMSIKITTAKHPVPDQVEIGKIKIKNT